MDSPLMSALVLRRIHCPRSSGSDPAGAVDQCGLCESQLSRRLSQDDLRLSGSSLIENPETTVATPVRWSEPCGGTVGKKKSPRP